MRADRHRAPPLAHRRLALTGVVIGTRRCAHADGRPADEAAIRAARAQSNQAIAAHDVPGIARHWPRRAHRHLDQRAGHGRDANGERMAQQFAAAARHRLRTDTVIGRGARARGPSPRSAARGPADGPSPTAWSRLPAPTWRSGGSSATGGTSRPSCLCPPRAADRATASARPECVGYARCHAAVCVDSTSLLAVTCGGRLTWPVPAPRFGGRAEGARLARMRASPPVHRRTVREHAAAEHRFFAPAATLRLYRQGFVRAPTLRDPGRADRRRPAADRRRRPGCARSGSATPRCSSRSTAFGS